MVLLGCALTRAKFLRFSSLLMTELLPTLDLPANTICGSGSYGKSLSLTAERRNSALCKFGFFISILLYHRCRCRVRCTLYRCGLAFFCLGRREKSIAVSTTVSMCSAMTKLMFSRTTGTMSFRVAPLSFGMHTVLMPARYAAMVFSRRPPIGSTRPRSVTSPVMRNLVTNRRAGQRRNQRRGDRHACGRAVLRNRCLREVNVQIVVPCRTSGRCSATLSLERTNVTAAFALSPHDRAEITGDF